ncbi:MAG: FecR family protein [Sphingobacteriaceae bacterium]
MNEDLKIAIVKYVTGQADDVETAEVKRWIKADPENEAYYAQLCEVWHNSLYSENGLIDTEKAYKNFVAKTNGAGRYFMIPLWQKVAVAVVLLCFCTIGLYNFDYKFGGEKLLEVSVKKGEIQKLVLPDGTSVWINAGSKIRYSENFGVADRTVYLEGEAYFDIAKKETPFLVKAAQFTIRDIGTIFNIKSYPEDRVFEATVVEGQISVESELKQHLKNKVLVDANQVLKITDVRKTQLAPQADQKQLVSAFEEVKVVQLNPAQLSEYNGWKDDLLVFDGDTFEEIARVIERRFNVSIVIADEELKKYKYSGTFKNIRDISKVFKVIKQNTPISYTTNGSLITIEKANLTN